MKVRLVPVAIAAAVVIFTSSGQSRADALQDFYAKLYAFFAEQNMLPVISPRNEIPGDVYATPNGSFLGRKNQCFPSLSPRVSQTSLPRLDDVNRYAVTGMGSSAAVEKLVKGSAKADAEFQNRIAISYGPRVETVAVTEVDIEEGLRSTMPEAAECLAKIRAAFGANDPSAAARGVPWIIQEVWASRESLRYTTQQTIDADGKAKLATELGRINGDLEVRFEQDAASTVLVVVEKRIFPVAWRPAYISLDDVTRLRELEKRGLFDRFLASIGMKESKLEVLKRLRNDFPKELLPPPEIEKQMSVGKPIPFSDKNPDHLEYLRNAALLFAISYEMAFYKLL